MTCYQKIKCPHCGSTKIIKSGKSTTGAQRYLCQNTECERKTFMQDYRYRACETGMTKRIIEMAVNASGIRDTARVLKISKNTVISRLKKKKVN